jgi:simple sugar transport system permease protein
VTSGTEQDVGAASAGPPSNGGTGGAGQSLSLVKRFLTLREGSIIVVTLITLLYFTISTDHFFSGSNLRNLLPYFAPFAIMAAGQVFVMTLGEIDLSIGAVYLFVPFLWNSIHNAGIPVFLAMLIAIAAALLVGAINGFFTAYVGIASFVVTLGMTFFLDGLTLVISHSTQITTPGTNLVSNDAFATIFGAGTYSELFWALGIVIILQIVLSRTRWGLYTVSVGGNKIAAAEAGIKVKRVTLRNFILCAGFAALVGVLEAVRVGSANPDPSGSNQILFEVVSAVIIGGTLMTGGEGTVVGALIGALFLGILNEGLTIKGVSSNYLDLYLGIAIIIAMVFNVYVQRVRKGSGRAG